VYTQVSEVPSQSVYVQVYVFGPEQTGSAPTIGPVGITGSPHELTTTGGVGTACASLIQGTVDPSSASKTKTGASIV
jgi:hypothetical protein